jgi:predicted CXXCH cytochrome family protein
MKLIFLSLLVFKAYAKEIVMNHMPEGDKCIVCHQANTPNQLLLRDGTKIKSTQVDALCAQCHGIKYRRWLDGLHGKVINSWKAESLKRLSCIACHNPHIPKFPKYKAVFPPPHLQRKNHTFSEF